MELPGSAALELSGAAGVLDVPGGSGSAAEGEEDEGGGADKEEDDNDEEAPLQSPALPPLLLLPPASSAMFTIGLVTAEGSSRLFRSVKSDNYLVGQVRREREREKAEEERRWARAPSLGSRS